MKQSRLGEYPEHVLQVTVLTSAVTVSGCLPAPSSPYRIKKVCCCHWVSRGRHQPFCQREKRKKKHLVLPQ